MTAEKHTCAVHEEMVKGFESQIQGFEKKLDLSSDKMDLALELLHKNAETNAMQTVLITQLQKDLDKEEQARKNLEVLVHARFGTIARAVWMGVGAASLFSILVPLFITLAINWDRLIR